MSEKLTDEEFVRCGREAAAKATPGPWRAADRHETMCLVVCGENPIPGLKPPTARCEAFTFPHGTADANADFLVHARTAYPEALDRIERLLTEANDSWLHHEHKHAVCEDLVAQLGNENEGLRAALKEALDRIEQLTQEKAAPEGMPSSRPLTTFEKQAYEVGRRAGFRQATDLSRGGSWVRVDALTDTQEGPTLDLLQSFVTELLARNEQLTLALAEERRQKGGICTTPRP